MGSSARGLDGRCARRRDRVVGACGGLLRARATRELPGVAVHAAKPGVLRAGSAALRVASLTAVVVAVAAAPTAASSASPHRGAAPAATPPPPAIENPSWSGELAWASKNATPAFDHVRGAWVQPSVAPAPGAQYADTWVGIDGYDGKLLQAGTMASTRDGTVSYDAWFVAWTGTASGMTVLSEPVAAGDHMHVSIDREAAQTWRVELDDTTAGWTWSTTVTYPATGSTAEWIEEAPGTWSTPSHYQTLADYGSATFTTVSANGRAPASLTTYDIVQNGTVASYASTYDPADGSFLLRYGQPAPVPTAGTISPTSGPASPGAVFGTTSDGTAAAEFTRAFPYGATSCPPSRAAVVATTRDYQDALSSQFLAQSLTTGTLLTPTGALSAVTASTLEEEGISTVYIVGGPLAVSTAVATAIGELPADQCGGRGPSGSIAVHRIFGATEYATARMVAQFVGVAPSRAFPGAYAATNATGGAGRYNDTSGNGSSAPSGPVPTAIVASGQEFQDAQAASMIAYHTGLPLLLTPSATLSPTALGALENLGIGQVILVGGPSAVSNAVAAALAQAGISVLRVAGKDFTDTARELARFELAGTSTGLGWTNGHRAMVARGDGFTDGLAGAVLENPHNSATGGPGTARPLLLTETPTSLGNYLISFLEATGHTGIDGTAAKTITTLTPLGGPLALSTTAIAAMETDLDH